MVSARPAGYLPPWLGDSCQVTAVDCRRWLTISSMALSDRPVAGGAGRRAGGGRDLLAGDHPGQAVRGAGLLEAAPDAPGGDDACPGPPEVGRQLEETALDGPVGEVA